MGDVDPIIGGIATVLATVLAVLFKRGLNGLRELIVDACAAAVERARRRDRKITTTKRRIPQEVPIEIEPETTDIHELIDLERAERAERKRTKGKLTEQRKALGERPPRPGTHHDRDEE